MSYFAGAVGLLVFSSWALLRLAKGCGHRRTTTPRKDEEGAYVRCLECGARIAAPLWDMELYGAWREAPPLMPARADQKGRA